MPIRGGALRDAFIAELIIDAIVCAGTKFRQLRADVFEKLRPKY